MIPDNVQEFLQGPIMFNAGTRTADNVPHMHRVWGGRVDDATKVSFHVPALGTAQLRENLADNGEVALTVHQAVSHEAYQLKGKMTAVEPSSERDVAEFEAYRETVASFFNQALGYPKEALIAVMQAPEMTVTFEVREVFLQTPGPEAGKKLTPEEG